MHLIAKQSNRLACTPIRLQTFSRSRPAASKLHTSVPLQSPNRIFNPIRNEEEFSSLLLLSASSRIPLITLWTASWCASCRHVTPLVRRLIDEDKIGEEQGGVSFAEVEIDAPDNAELAFRYSITSVPTMLAFTRQEAQLETRVSTVADLSNKAFLKQWIEKEASRGGAGGAGGSWLSFLR